MATPDDTTSVPLPKKAQRLIDLAEKHDWRVEREATKVEGASAAVALAFYRPLPSGRLFVFMIGYAKAEWSGRWSTLKRNRCPVTGSLLPGDGGSRDKLASMLGSPLEERHWEAARHLEWWLAHPEGVLAFDWVAEAEEGS